MSFNPRDLFVAVFSEEGNLSNKELGVDGSLSPIDFVITPPDNFGWEVTRVVFKIRDDQLFTADNFGSLNELTNGLKLYLTVGGNEVELTEIPIRTNADLGMFASRGGIEDYGGGDNFLIKVWETPISEAGISILEGEKMIVRVSDNLVELNSFQIVASGRQQRRPSLS